MVIPITWQRYIAVGLGLAVCVYSIILYAVAGFQPSVITSLFVGIVVISMGLTIGAKPSHIASRFSKWDLVALCLIAATFIPLYSSHTYDFPHQMNEDEVTIMTVAKEVSTAPASDLLGPSNYFGFPVLIFWIYGKLGSLMGGLDLESMRTLHSLSGALIVVLSYLLFRQLFDRLWTVVATVILGFNHSLFFISRMAMRDNSALLMEIASIAILLRGWQKRSLLWSFWGGVVSGLTFYVYYPSRITFFIWIAGIMIYGLAHRLRDRKMLPLLGIAVLGFVITIAPIIIGSIKNPEPKNFFEEHILLLPAGRAVQQHWVFANTERDGIFTNIRNGLLAFNKPYADQGNIYRHPGYGFVDIFTGLLIWVGIGVFIIDVWRKGSVAFKEILMLSGFLITWLSLAFVLNKAPNYTRLLITLPFVAYLATRALSGIALLAKKHIHYKPLWWPYFVASLGVALIASSNIAIAKNFYDQGKLDNSGLANTVRYLEKHKEESTSKWYFAPSSPTSYLSWGDESAWRYWLSFFLYEQPLVIVNPSEGLPFMSDPPLARGNNYLLTNRDLWEYLYKDGFPYKIKNLSNITPDGRLIVIKF
jgi:hypothetical protein